jgi:hypothetical protein
VPDPAPERDYLLRLRPERSAEPAPVRLRKLLKIALRALGLRCVHLKELVADAPASPETRKP